MLFGSPFRRRQVLPAVLLPAADGLYGEAGPLVDAEVDVGRRTPRRPLVRVSTA
jgi:hypothetical protein